MWRFVLGAIAAVVLYLEALAIGVQTHRTSVALMDFSCVTPQAEMPVVDLSTLRKWEEGQSDLFLFACAITALFALAAYVLGTVSMATPVNQLAIVKALAEMNIVDQQEPYTWLREWMICSIGKIKGS